MIENMADKFNDYTDNVSESIRTLTLKLQSKENTILSLEAQIQKLEKEIEKNRRANLIVNSVDKFKKIVQLYAFGYSAGMIYKVLTEEYNMDTTVEEIDAFINKIDFADIEIQEYYVQCKKSFQEKAELDKSFLASSNIKKFALIENELSISLVKAKESGDEATKLKVMDLLIKVYEKMNAVYGKVGGLIDKAKVNEILASYERKTDEVFHGDNVVQFKKSDVNAV